MASEPIILGGFSLAFAIFAFMLLTKIVKRAWEGLGFRYFLFSVVLFGARSVFLILAGLEYVPGSVLLLVQIEVLLYVAIGFFAIGVWRMFDIFYKKKMVVL